MDHTSICILQGSPRKEGNTMALLQPFMAELKTHGHSGSLIRLYEKTLSPCMACRVCQRDWSVFGCPQPDDMQEIFDAISACRLLVLATPIYSWYCTPPMKSVLDRLVYGMNKYYGETKGPALWAGKSLALITTCGYRPEHGADLWEAGVKRYCKHSQLEYKGMLAERHLGYQSTFMDEEKEGRAREFARTLLREIQPQH